MASYRVFLSRSAERELRAVPKADLRRIERRIRGLAGDPFPSGCQKLAGAEGWRLRQGDWRVVYVVDAPARRVVVVKVGNRREVYR